MSIYYQNRFVMKRLGTFFNFRDNPALDSQIFKFGTAALPRNLKKIDN
jgi:hypothetical protein